MSLFKNKIIKIIFKSIVILFALYGFVLTSLYFAVKFHLTDDPGGVSRNDRLFQKIEKNKVDTIIVSTDSSYQRLKEITEVYSKIRILNEYNPINAELIFNSFNKSLDVNTANKMLDLVCYYLKDSTDYTQKLKENTHAIITNYKNPNESVYEWMNIPEWDCFKDAALKDKRLIDSASKVTNVEARLIVSCLVGEQIRLFNSKREVFKNVIAPLKILSVESVFSLGVTGIKIETAIKIENYLKDSSCVFYMGKEYENLLDFKSTDFESERFNRLVDYKNHYYSYLYAAIFLKQVQLQWEKAGFDISDRPEILATLFNVGFPQSVPKSNPCVGGSKINVNDVFYTFGLLASDFYYSGELYDEFPYTACSIYRK